MSERLENAREKFLDMESKSPAERAVGEGMAIQGWMIWVFWSVTEPGFLPERLQNIDEILVQLAEVQEMDTHCRAGRITLRLSSCFQKA